MYGSTCVRTVPDATRSALRAAALADSAEVREAVVRLQAHGNSARPLSQVEADALATIYVRYCSMMRHTAERLLEIRADAEDVVHEVVCKLPTLMHQYQHGGLGGWLRRIVVTTVQMRTRRSWRETELHEPDPMHVELLDVIVERTDFAVRALATLPHSLRMVVLLRLCHGYSHEEVASALGITVTASEIRLSRALKRLRSRFAESQVTALANRVKITRTTYQSASRRCVVGGADT